MTKQSGEVWVESRTWDAAAACIHKNEYSLQKNTDIVWKLLFSFFIFFYSFNSVRFDTAEPDRCHIGLTTGYDLS